MRARSFLLSLLTMMTISGAIADSAAPTPTSSTTLESNDSTGSRGSPRCSDPMDCKTVGKVVTVKIGG